MCARTNCYVHLLTRLLLHVCIVFLFSCVVFITFQNVGEHDFIGEFDMTVRQLLNSKSKFKVINPEKAAAAKVSGDKYKHSGTVTFKVAEHYTMISDVDREADIALVKHRREYKESEVNPTKRNAFLAFMAGGQALVKAQALVRMATGLALHKTADELHEEATRIRQQKQHQVLQEEGLQRMGQTDSR